MGEKKAVKWIHKHLGDAVKRTPLNYVWRINGRRKQLIPITNTEYNAFLILAGRGGGKTRTGAEFCIDGAKDKKTEHVAIIGQTFADTQKVMMEGPGGILQNSPPGFRPIYKPSKRYVEWPNGVIGTTYSADRPDQLRGPAHGRAWWDEIAKAQYPELTLSNLRLGLRIGERPCALFTGTPLPTQTVLGLAKDPDILLINWSYRDNEKNISGAFVKEIEKRYRGTRLYDQEALGLILQDNPLALWKREWIERNRVQDPKSCPTLICIVVAVDPNVSNTERSDEMGIVVVGLDGNGHHYIVGDYSMRGTPEERGKTIKNAYDIHKADIIVFEANQGGDMVGHVLAMACPFARIEPVHASRGKVTRAQPISMNHERGMSHFVGCYPELEEQLCEWIPGESSPDRMDALVWGETYLLESGRGQKESQNLVDITAGHGVDLSGWGDLGE